MDKKTGIIIGLIALVVIVSGVYASMDSKDYMTIKDDVKDTAMMEKDTTENQNEVIQKSDDEVMKKEDTSIMEKSDTMTKVGSYEAYSADKLARAETGDVVLFFHAPWCPTCRGLNSSIESNLTSIPLGVTILKTDYDTETALKKKYGVTYQHTLVQVDKDGNMIKKWSGGNSLDNLLSQIQ